MKKHMKIYYIVAIIGTIVDVFVIIYSNFVSELKYKYQLLWGSSSIVLLALIILSHLKKLKDKMVYYFVNTIKLRKGDEQNVEISQKGLTKGSKPIEISV